MIQIYHHNTASTDKDFAIAEFANPQSRVRVLFATEALGLGVDLPDIKRVVLYGLVVQVTDDSDSECENDDEEEVLVFNDEPLARNDPIVLNEGYALRTTYPSNFSSLCLFVMIDLSRNYVLRPLLYIYSSRISLTSLFDLLIDI